LIESQFHKNFKLQGQSFNTTKEILEFSKGISDEVFVFLEEWFNNNSFIEAKTSGSTGNPKVISLQKKHMINSAIATGEYFKLSEKTTALLCMSPNFIAGKMMFVRALALGWHLDVVDPISNPFKNIEIEYDFSAVVPIQLFQSLNDICKVKKLIVGGGVVSNELLEKIQQIDTEVYATYGMTETITHIAVKKLNNFSHNDDISSYNYQILPNIKISIDKRSCLVIDAYKVSDELIITNDLVELISETEFKWLGRFDSIINSGGIKLIPEQIEGKFSKIISKPFLVAGISDEVLGEKLILIIESADNEKSNILKQLKSLETLSKYEIPKEIYFLKNFVETETKKINRKATLDLLKNIC
jgi:O-succinylbenzoic acid--CoA ligase